MDIKDKLKLNRTAHKKQLGVSLSSVLTYNMQMQDEGMHNKKCRNKLLSNNIISQCEFAWFVFFIFYFWNLAKCISIVSQNYNRIKSEE